MDVLLDSGGPTLNLKQESAANRWGLIRYLALRSSRPDVLECTMTRPHPDALRMAILAWSFSEWSNYSGYAYTATAGAHVVRRAILDGSISIPESAVVFYDQDFVPPLRDPDPVLVVHAERPVSSIRDVDEFIGIGVGWGESLVAILPAASDATGTVYERLVALHRDSKTVRYIPIRPMMNQLGVDSLMKVMVINDGSSDWEMRVTDYIEQESRSAWLSDSFPRRLDPTKGTRRQYPAGEVQRFYMVEDMLDPRINRAPPRPPKSQRKGLREVRQNLGLVAVRRAPLESWHLATHLWIVNDKPTNYGVFCGTEIRWPAHAKRPVSEINRLGVGFVCARCAEIMTIKPAHLRKRPSE